MRSAALGILMLATLPACDLVFSIADVDDPTGIDAAVDAPVDGRVDSTVPDAMLDDDLDGDGIDNAHDTCPLTYAPLDEDMDEDGIGNACDPSPETGTQVRHFLSTAEDFSAVQAAEQSEDWVFGDQVTQLSGADVPHLAMVELALQLPVTVVVRFEMGPTLAASGDTGRAGLLVFANPDGSSQPNGTACVEQQFVDSSRDGATLVTFGDQSQPVHAAYNPPPAGQTRFATIGIVPTVTSSGKRAVECVLTRGFSHAGAARGEAVSDTVRVGLYTEHATATFRAIDIIESTPTIPP